MARRDIRACMLRSTRGSMPKCETYVTYKVRCLIVFLTFPSRSEGNVGNIRRGPSPQIWAQPIFEIYPIDI